MATDRAALRRYLFFGLAALGLLMGTINLTSVAVALPAMVEGLDTSLSWVSWTITGYNLTMIIVLPIAGQMSDALGRKRVFLFCLGCFTVGSLLCSVAPNVGLLILFRVLQAIGGGGLMPSAAGIVSDQFKERRSQAIGLFTSINVVGNIIGPNVGGFILEHWTWREIFFINVPLSLLAMVGTHLLLREVHQPGRLPRFDVAGLVLFAGGMLTLMSTMTWLGSDPTLWRTPLFWLLPVVALVLFWAFIRQERRVAHAMMDLDLIVHRQFWPAHLYSILFGSAAQGILALVPYYAVVAYGLSPALSGAVMTPRALAALCTSALTSLLILRLGYRLPMIAGMVVVSTSFVLLSLGWTHVSLGPVAVDDFWVLAFAIGIAGFGTGMASPTSSNVSLEFAPDKVAAISGLRGMARQLGGILGVSSIVLTLSFFEDKAAGMRISFLVLAVVLLLSVPLTLMLPELESARRKKKAAVSAATR